MEQSALARPRRTLYQDDTPTSPGRSGFLQPRLKELPLASPAVKVPGGPAVVQADMMQVTHGYCVLRLLKYTPAASISCRSVHGTDAVQCSPRWPARAGSDMGTTVDDVCMGAGQEAFHGAIGLETRPRPYLLQ